MRIVERPTKTLWVLVDSIKGHKLKYPLSVQVARLYGEQKGWEASVRHIGIFSAARGKTIKRAVKLANGDLLGVYDEYRRFKCKDKDPEYRAQVKLFLAVMKKRV